MGLFCLSQPDLFAAIFTMFGEKQQAATAIMQGQQKTCVQLCSASASSPIICFLFSEKQQQKAEPHVLWGARLHALLYGSGLMEIYVHDGVVTAQRCFQIKATVQLHSTTLKFGLVWDIPKTA
jgi:hypothetical protein